MKHRILIALSLLIVFEAGIASADPLSLNVTSMCLDKAEQTLLIEYYAPFYLDESTVTSGIQRSSQEDNTFVLSIFTDQGGGLMMSGYKSFRFSLEDLADLGLSSETTLKYLFKSGGIFNIETSTPVKCIPECGTTGDEKCLS